MGFLIFWDVELAQPIFSDLRLRFMIFWDLAFLQKYFWNLSLEDFNPWDVEFRSIFSWDLGLGRGMVYLPTFGFVRTFVGMQYFGILQ